jgi:hypothetical protein
MSTLRQGVVLHPTCSSLISSSSQSPLLSFPPVFTTQSPSPKATSKSLIFCKMVFRNCFSGGWQLTITSSESQGSFMNNMILLCHFKYIYNILTQLMEYIKWTSDCGPLCFVCFCGFEDWTQALTHAKKMLYHLSHSSVPFCFYFVLETVSLTLPGLTSNLLSSCLWLLSGWDYRYAPLCLFFFYIPSVAPHYPQNKI